MSHSLILDVPEIVYQSLAEKANRNGKRVEEIALEILELVGTDRSAKVDDFEQAADELADYIENNMPTSAKPLSDYAVSREGIYEDHL
jgi:hypothetical protein